MPEPLRQQAQAYDAEGNPVSPDEAPKAVREGRAFFQKGTKVFVRNPDGDVVTVPSSDVHLPGYQVLSPVELKESRLKRDAETGVGMAKTAGEGLVRGATMGFAGPEQFYDSAGREAARARQQYNPGIAGGSELAGTLGAAIATTALTGGAGAGAGAEMTGGRLAAMAARGVLTPFRAAAALGDAAEGAAGLVRAEGLIGSGLKMGARGLAEGALYGAGHEVSQAALEDVPLTAERLLAGAWDGAKAGGAFGLGLGVLSHGVGKAGRAIVGRMAESGDDLGKATGTWAENAAFKQQVGNNGKIYDQATNFGQDMARPARIGRKLLDADMPTATPAALKRASELADDAVARLKATALAADEAGVVANPERLLASVDDQIAKLRETPFGDFQAIADRVEKQVAPFRERFAARAAGDELDQLGLVNTKYARDGMRDESLDFARKAYAPESPSIFPGPSVSPAERAQQIATTKVKPVRVEIYPDTGPVLGDGRHRMQAAIEAGAKDIRANVVTYDADGNVLKQVERLVSLAGEPAQQAPGLRFSELWELRKRLDDTINFESRAGGPAKEALMDVRNAFRQELDDTLAGAADSAPPELLAAWKKVTEDYSDFALIKKSLKELTNRKAKNRAVSPSDYAAGALMGILTGNAVTGMATSALAGGVHKLIRERGLGVMAKIADRAGGVASEMETAGKVAAMLEAPKRLVTPAAVNVAQQFERYSQALTTAQADPAKFAERMASATADLSLRTPELAQQVQATMLADLAYLDKLHPAPTSQKSATLTPQAVKAEYYSFDQRKTFVAAATALDNPLGIFNDIARGELPLAGINALKERRPLLFGEMQRTVIKYTAQRKEELPYSRRMLLGVAFGFPADWSMLNVGKIQESLVMSAQGPGGAPPSPNDPRAAPSKVGKDPGAEIKPGIF